MNKVYILGGAQTDFERNWKKKEKEWWHFLRRLWLMDLERLAFPLMILEI